MRALTLLVALLGLTSPVARARDADAPHARPLTAMHAGPLGRAELVLFAELESIRSVRQMALAHLRPLRTLKGEAPKNDRLTVLVRGPRPTHVEDRPSVPFLVESSRGKYVFFLHRQEEGVAYALDTLFPVKNRLGLEKLAALERQAELLAIPDYEVRARQTMAWLLDELRAEGTWTRVHTARELNYLSRVRPDLFDGRVRTRLQKLVRRGALPSQRKWLALLLKGLHEEVPAEAGGGEGGRDEAARGSLAQALLEASTTEARIEVYRKWLHTGGYWGDALDRARTEEAAVRVWLVETLAEGGYRAALDRIRALYAFEEETAVHKAIVRATGTLGDADDVEWLSGRVGSLAVRHDALVALARIRTPEALEALRSWKGRLAEEGAGADLQGLIDYLLSTAFVEVETSAGRRAG